MVPCGFCLHAVTKIVVSFSDQVQTTLSVLTFVRCLLALLVAFVDLDRCHLVSLCVFFLLIVNASFSFRFLETGCRSDFNKIRMKLSEMGTVQLQNLVRKSRQLRDSIQQDVMKEDCVYVSDYEDRNLMNLFGSDPFSEYGRRIEVVTLD